MDRITGLQDLQDKGFNKTNSGAWSDLPGLNDFEIYGNTCC